MEEFYRIPEFVPEKPDFFFHLAWGGKRNDFVFAQDDLFSVAASVPAWFAHNFFVEKFAGLGRLLGNGLPLALTALVFAAVGALLLFVTRDQAAMQILRKRIK